MGLQKRSVVRRVKQVPGGRAVMRNNLRYDRAATRSLVWIFGQGDMNVVVLATEQVALHTFTGALCQRVVLVNVRVVRVEHETHKHDRLSFAQFGFAVRVINRDDVCELRAAFWRFALWYARLFGAGFAKIGKRLQRDWNNPVRRRAEIVLQRILLVVGGALVATAIATKKINSLRFVREGLQLQRQRLAGAAHELHFLRHRSCRRPSY